MLVHICCSVDSHYFLQRLREDFPDEKLVGFFYDPNIHPYSEYRLRLLDVQRSCDMLGVELIEGPYDIDAWMEAVRGHEHVPEKGSRCSICFDRRFAVSAKKAREIGEERMTSTLLTSPKKSIDQLREAGERIAAAEGVSFVTVDYRVGGGTQRQQEEAKRAKLYRQDYCGCLYGLTMQRQQQNMPVDELFSPIDGRTLPGSIEERIEMYEKRLKIEARGEAYRIVRQKFLNYRLKLGWVRRKKETLVSHILPFSVMKRRYTNGKIEFEHEGLWYFNREEIRFMTLERYNRLAGSDYEDVAALVFDPPPFKKELEIRERVGLGLWDLSPLIVLEEIPEGKLEIFIEGEQYRDVREILVCL
ncbi:epoxyqueuosine reductase QueH [Hydrogenimonas sp.]|uniref:epoxyqueuosine reductase QueH n=1 Tax=Hydrogenimonas sp. TaxID=2231112 RepID=UPI0026050A83|nr:epoxyqueuosine reductase QueH [Hydrogenimonas sp.]